MHFSEQPFPELRQPGRTWQAALQPHVDNAGTVHFTAPYVVVSATRRS